MQGANDAFYFIVDKIFGLQGFFLGVAFDIARVAFLIALLLAIINYVLNGTGLKDSLIKIGKALAFFLIVWAGYPAIVSFVTSWTFSLASGGIRPGIQNYYDNKITIIKQEVEMVKLGAGSSSMQAYMIPNTAGMETYMAQVDSVVKGDVNGDMEYFDELLTQRNLPSSNMSYTTVAPAAALKLILVVAGECIRSIEETPKVKVAGPISMPDFGTVLKALACAFFVILTGALAILEYLLAFLEFMLVATVGVIMLPLCIWEGSKFMSEKFIGAMLGFFIKLLLCNLIIFLMIFIFVTMSHMYAATPFSGRADQIIMIVFTCLLTYYLSKSAGAIAQGLLTGAPSLSATGAIAAATGAIAAGAATLGLAKKAVGGVAGAGAKTLFGVAGAGASAVGSTARVLQNNRLPLAARLALAPLAFAGSMFGSAAGAAGAGMSSLTRSLLGGGGGSGGTGGRGNNRMNWRERWMNRTDDSGRNLSMADYFRARFTRGRTGQGPSNF